MPRLKISLDYRCQVALTPLDPAVHACLVLDTFFKLITYVALTLDPPPIPPAHHCHPRVICSGP